MDRRTRIRRQAKRRAAAGQARATVRAVAFERDHHACQLAGSTLGPCYGPLTAHHLWKEGQGGPYVPINLLTLCASGCPPLPPPGAAIAGGRPWAAPKAPAVKKP